MAKKRLVFLSEFVGIRDRGVETYVLELKKRLEKDFFVEVLTGADAYSLKKIQAGKYDVVIATNGRLQALKASLGRLIGGYKLIIPGQAGIGRDDIWNILFCKPDYYIALTDYELNWAKKLAWGSKLEKIPNGVDLEKFSPDGPRINLSFQGKTVISVAALEWYKYHDRTIKAVAQLKDVNLLIVGRGSKEDELKRLGQKLLGERFRIMHAKFNDIPNYYRSADLFVLPSWIRESFGIVYVEAMASALAVVAPDDPPRREIIGQAGILTDVEDTQKFAIAIDLALEKNWDNLPRKQAEKFSWDNIADQYSKLLKEI